MEARDASGRVVGFSHVEVLVLSRAMAVLLGLASVVGVALIVGSSIWLEGAWALAIVVLGGILAMIALPSIVFTLWGSWVGLPWRFTPLTADTVTQAADRVDPPLPGSTPVTPAG